MKMLDRILAKLEEPKNEPQVFIRSNISRKNNVTLDLINETFKEIIRKKSKIRTFLTQDLTEIYIDDFDSEQIWQQLQLKNRSIFNYISELAVLLSYKDELLFPLKKYIPDIKNKNDSSESSSEDDVNDDSDSNLDENGIDLESEEEMDFEEESKQNAIDDQFFSIKEMENFLQKQEEDYSHDNKKDDGFYIDYFQDLPSDEDTEKLKYDDFFADPLLSKEGTKKRKTDDDEAFTDLEEEYSGKKVRFSNYKPDSDSDGKETLSSLQMRQSKLQKKISKLEEKALAEKPWQLRGEVDASKRPVNSLLEEVVEYDVTQRPAPVITEEVTHTLENIIINRIKDSIFDDVVRKIKPIKTPSEFKKELILNQQKSKFSLAEIYEQEYLKQKQKQDNTEEETDKNELTEEKEEILKMMNSVFRKLDTLSNFHYTPKPCTADLKVVNNLPAIIMEEATPAAVSDANLLAPEEIASIVKRPLLGKDERTSTDKKRERRKKKHFQAKKFKRDLKNQNSAVKVKTLLKTRNVNMAVQDNMGNSLKSSTKFFTQLQDEVHKDLQGRHKEKREKKNFNAKLLKL